MFHNLSGPAVPLHPEWAPGVSLASVHTSQDPVHPVLRQSGDSASAKLGHVPFDFKFVPPLTYFSTKIKKNESPRGSLERGITWNSSSSWLKAHFLFFTEKGEGHPNSTGYI